MDKYTDSDYLKMREAFKDAGQLSTKVVAAGSGTGNDSPQTLTGTGTFFSIHNSSITNSLTFTIGSITITVAAGASYGNFFTGFTSVSVTATADQIYNWTIGG
jgi:hypothetical protein